MKYISRYKKIPTFNIYGHCIGLEAKILLMNIFASDFHTFIFLLEAVKTGGGVIGGV